MNEKWKTSMHIALCWMMGKDDPFIILEQEGPPVPLPGPIAPRKAEVDLND